MAESNIQEIILIGRDQTCNFIVDDSSVSRNHAQIINYGTHVCVVDLGSINGTFVNGVNVSSETSLHPGDELKVGNVVVPWEQLVDSSKGGKGGKKTWVWILIVGIVLLLLGAAVAAYFLWIRGNLEKSKKENEELYDEVITGAKKKQEADSLLMLTQAAADSAEAEAEKRILEARKREAEANKKADKAEKDANARVKAADAKEKEAIKKEQDVKQREANAQKKEQEVNQKEIEIGKKEQEIEQQRNFYDRVIAAIDALNEGDAKDICNDLEITFNDNKSAKEALKEEFASSFRDNNEARKQQIGKALTKYKKQ